MDLFPWKPRQNHLEERELVNPRIGVRDSTDGMAAGQTTT